MPLNSKNDYQTDVVCQFIYKIIIDETVLHQKTKNAFWNYECNDFYKNDKLFEIQYLELNSIIEKLSRSIIAQGRKVPYNSNDINLIIKPLKKSFANISLVDVKKELANDHLEMIKIINSSSKLIANNSIFGTNRLLESIIQKHNYLINQLV